MKKIFRRIFILLIVIPFGCLIAITAFFLSIPIWILTGNEIYNKCCDEMVSLTQKFYYKT